MSYLKGEKRQVSTDAVFTKRKNQAQPPLTKEIRVEVLAVGVGHPLEGRALLLHSHFQPVWVDGRNNNDPSLVDQLQTGE